MIRDETRLAALRRYDILDTKPEPAFDRITQLAAGFFDVPVALVNFVTGERQWFKSAVGMGEKETGLDVSFCVHTVEKGETLVVEDLADDERFAGNSYVTERGVRFYAGAPLITASEERLGTLCLLDTEPRSLSPGAVEQLENMAAMVEDELELRREQAKHRQARADLKESRELHRHAQESAEVGGWTYDPQADELTWTDQTYRIHGLPPEAEVGVESALDFYTEESRPVLKSHFERIVEEGGSYDLELSIETAEGERRRVRTIGEAHRADGETIRVDGAIQDITERKEREKHLRVLSEAVAQAKEAVLITEAEPLGEPGPRIVYVNEAIKEMTGYAEEEVLGKTPRLFQGPETDRAVLDEIREALEAGEPWKGETINYRKDGTPYRVQWNLAPVRDEEGTIEYWVSVQRDVTEEGEREDTLRRQKVLLEQTQRLAGAWETDLRTNQVRRSEEALRVLELEPGTSPEVEDLFALVDPEARPALSEAFEQCVQEGTPYDLELPVETAKGNRRWVRTVAAPSETEDGAVVKVAGAVQDITERKEAKQRLERSRERLQMAIEGGNIGTWDWDLDTGEVIFNRQWAEMLGYSREELDFHFSTWEDLVHPDDLERATDVLERYIEGEVETYDPEIRMRTKAGDWKWIQTIGKVIDRDEEGKVTRAAGIHLDIHERKQSRRELEQYREYTGRLLDAIDDLFFSIDEEGRFCRWNDSIPEVTGYTDAEMEEITAFDLVPESERERVAAAITKAMETGHAQIVAPLLRKDGKTIPYEFVGTLVEHPDGGLRAVGIGRDVTERRRREKRLERLNDLFAKAQDLASVGGWEYDVRTGEDLGTDEVYRIHGLSPEADSSVKRSIEFYHPDDRPTIREAFRRAVEEGEPYDLELRLITKDGEQKWVRTRGEPQREGGEIVRVRGTTQDVTEQVRQREALKEAKEAAEEGNRIKTALLSNMNHELRTPLTSIITFSELIRDNPEEASRFVDRILGGGKRLLYTLNAVMDFAEIEGGGVSVTPQPFHLGQVVRSVANANRARARQKGLDLSVEVAEEVRTFTLDEHLVERILTHLIHNAIKFTENGEVTVSARALGEAVELQVEDTGVGIDPDFLPHVFDEFAQQSSGYDRTHEGNGLGLTIVKRLVEATGGTINVESEPEEGTAVTVQLFLQG